jgi:tetratricopeptide (TPR) repeat protein
VYGSRRDPWDSSRQLFADQFEPYGSGFTYRRSQKGEAINVTAQERERFLDQFEHHIRRAKWIIYLGLTVVLGSIILLPVWRGGDSLEAIAFAGIALVMVPYFAYFRWAWAAPARELAGRTPIAGPRAPQEVQRLKFERITYKQLGWAALGGVAIPFIGNSRDDVLSGWNRLWLVFGVGLIVLAAVQAFRKWRFEQEDSLRNTIPPRPDPRVAEAPEQAGSPIKSQIVRYLGFAVLAGFAFVLFTPMGQQFARAPAFLPTLMFGISAWSVVTVVQGFAKGRIAPLVRGFHNTYDRETQPKRFWASMIWNGVLGGLCLWGSYEFTQDAVAKPLQDRCYNEGFTYTPKQALSACNELIDKRLPLGGWTVADVMMDRGIAYANLNDHKHAIADYSAALRLQSDYFEAYYNRGLSHQALNETSDAISDFTSAIQLKRDPDAYFNRGYAYERLGDLTPAIADFTEVIRAKPDRTDAYFYRWAAYKDSADEARAAADLAVLSRLNPKFAASLSRNGVDR